MADYQTQTCFSVTWPRAARDTLREAIALIGELALETPPGRALEQRLKELPSEVSGIVRKVAADCDAIGMGIISDTKEEMLIADEDGMFAPTMAADLLQAVMRAHEINEPLAVFYAEVCSKHRPGSFMGGGFVVTKDEIRFHHILDVVNDSVQEMKQHNTMNPRF